MDLTDDDRRLLQTLVELSEKQSYMPIQLALVSSVTQLSPTALDAAMTALAQTGFVETPEPGQVALTDLGRDFGLHDIEQRPTSILSRSKAAQALISAWIKLGGPRVLVDRQELLHQSGLSEAAFKDVVSGMGGAVKFKESPRQPQQRAKRPPAAELPEVSQEQIWAVLFLDVKGFSKLGENEIAAFVSDVLGPIQEVLKSHDAKYSNTWGDAVVAVFSSAKSAAKAALAIKALFLNGEGLLRNLTCRISLHSGDIQVHKNPITDRKDIFGYGVVLAARLEPATIPGHIFCTDGFASVLGKPADVKTSLLPDKVALPKGFGELAVHVVYRTGDSDPTAEVAEALKQTAVSRERPPQLVSLSDEDAKTVLHGWVLEQETAPSDAIFVATWRFSKLDSELGLELGSAAKYLSDLLRKSNWLEVVSQGPDTIVIRRQVIPENWT